MICLLSIFQLSLSVHAGEADVVDVTVKSRGADSYDFSVTVMHQDTGWDHYANRWEVLDEKGVILGTRTLHHPHVNEQPFTRRLSGIHIPSGIKSVVIRSHDSVHKYGGATVTVQLPMN
ncbi:MAG: hypothetical protein K1565_20855 [Candidatus Thiodiazotropha sp. (ex. Lucinisca nassula)]|nr:hypothetical protein [Candidatus Thiodiazotropha sp. (ex. Lucinisca nassula)]PUB76271.1 MAG: hypothetical protein DBP01_18805 [gamma proteobacterium symbiont of Ctena orbiculata]PUB79945.1 MAG: hypothetical protein DBP02_21595 [gamma proteobacterium symbiont of Ctena orbiculata]